MVSNWFWQTPQSCAVILEAGAPSSPENYSCDTLAVATRLFSLFWWSESIRCATKSKKHYQAQRRSNLSFQTTFLLFTWSAVVAGYQHRCQAWITMHFHPVSVVFNIKWVDCFHYFGKKKESQKSHLGMCSSPPTSASGPPQLPFSNHSRLPSRSVEGPSLFFVVSILENIHQTANSSFRERAVWRGSDKFGESVGEKWVNITWLLRVDSEGVHIHVRARKDTL